MRLMQSERTPKKRSSRPFLRALRVLGVALLLFGVVCLWITSPSGIGFGDHVRENWGLLAFAGVGIALLLATTPWRAWKKSTSTQTPTFRLFLEVDTSQTLVDWRLALMDLPGAVHLEENPDPRLNYRIVFRKIGGNRTEWRRHRESVVEEVLAQPGIKDAAFTEVVEEEIGEECGAVSH